MAAVIIDATETAGPGQLFQVLGDGFSATPMLRIAYVNGHEASLTTPPATAQAPLEIVAWGTQVVQARVPWALAAGLYAVWVSPDSGSTWSAPAFINRARITHWHFKECSSGHVIRAFGRNLVASGHLPSLLVGGISAKVNLADSDGEILSIVWPAGLTLTTAYSPVVNNGMGGSYGDATSPTTVTHRAGGVDVFGLGVPWGADFEKLSKTVVTSAAVADGVTNVRATIQAEIEAIKVAGGVLDFPLTGTYLIGTDSFTRNGWLALPSNVVLRLAPGAIFSFGSAGAGSGSRAGICTDTSASKCGVTGGTLVSTSGARVNFLVNLGGASKTFLVGTALNSIETGAWTSFKNSDQTVMRDCPCTAVLTAVAGTQTPWDAEACTFHWFYRNSGKWNSGRGLTCGFSLGPLTIEENAFVLDGSLYSGRERGSIEANGTWKTVILRNTFVVSPKYDSGDVVNDRECVDNQYAGSPGRQFVGTVTSAASTTLTDSTQNWTVNIFVPPATIGLNLPDHVSIVKGKGLGQTRRIVSNTATVLTLDAAWTVIPDATSHYNVTGWSAMDWLVRDNYFQDQYHGVIQIYFGGYKCMTKGNEIVNGDAIFTWAQHRLGLADKRLTLSWWYEIHENVLRLDADQLATKRSSIDIRMNHFEASDATFPTIFGALVLGTDIRRNKTFANPTTDVTSGADRIHNGIGVRVEVIHSATGVSEGARDPTNPGVVGTIVEDNQVVAVTGAQYRTGTGVALTAIDDASPDVATPQVSNVLGTGMSAGAVQTRSAISVNERKARRREGR